MSLQNEDWHERDFIRTDMTLRHKLTKNNLAKHKDLPLEFFDYRANEEFPCFPYLRTVQHCMNLYGPFTAEFMGSKTCLDSANWFTICVNNHNHYNLQKKYNSSAFMTSEDQSRTYTIEDVL